MAPQSIEGQRHWRTKTLTHARTLLEAPPEGVDLVALAPGTGHLATPEECEKLYSKALEASGGQAALDKVQSIATTLKAQVATSNSARMLAGPDMKAHQLRAWQAYDLAFMMERLGESTSVRRHGELRLEALAEELRGEVDPAVDLNIASVKKWGRASVKCRIRYGTDCSRLTDLNRAELVCPDIEVMYAAAEHLFSRWAGHGCRSDVRVVEWTDCYQEPMPGGYRHLQALVFIGGSIWELQFNTKAMLEAKKSAGHRLYKTTRFVKELLLFASMEGDLDVLVDLLAQPGVRAVADPNATRDKNGLTALHHAAFRGDASMARLLLDSDRFCEPADVWASDTTDYAGLPINYALLLRSYDVALLLAQHMAANSPVPRAAKERLAEAISAAVDAYEDLLYEERAEKERAKESDKMTHTSSRRSLHNDSAIVRQLLGVLAGLWTPGSPTAGQGGFAGEDPLAYAFRVGAASSAQVLLDSADPWTSDHEGRLPLERAVSSGLPGAAEAAAARMLREPQPTPLAAEAAWSLARVDKSHLPNSLLGQAQANDRRLRRRIFTCGALTEAEVGSGSRGDGNVSSQLRQFGALDHQPMKAGVSETQCVCLALESEEVLYVGDAQGAVQKWDARTFTHITTWKGHAQRVVCLLLGSKRQASDGTNRSRRLFSGSFDNTVRVWDLWRVTDPTSAKSDANCVGVLKHTEDVKALARQGSVLFVAMGSRIAMWDIEKVSSMRRCGELKGHNGAIDTLEMSGGRLFSAGQGGEVRVWARMNQGGGDSQQWHEVECWKGHSEGLRIYHLAVGPENSFFSAAHADGNRQVQLPRSGASTPNFASDTPASKANAEVCFWTAGGKVKITKAAPQPITGMQYAEGLLFTADAGGSVRLWNATTGRIVSVIPACPGRISALLVSDGGGDEDGNIGGRSARRNSELSADGPEERADEWPSFDSAVPWQPVPERGSSNSFGEGRIMEFLTRLPVPGGDKVGSPPSAVGGRRHSTLRRPPIADLSDALPKLKPPVTAGATTSTTIPISTAPTLTRPPPWVEAMVQKADAAEKETTSSWPLGFGTVNSSSDTILVSAGTGSAPPFPPFRKSATVESRRQNTRPPRVPSRGAPLGLP